MGSKRVPAISSRRRGLGRVAAFVGVVAIAAAGCGRSGHGAQTDSEKAADVEVLNAALAQELTAVAAYRRGMPLLGASAAAVARLLLGQGQAHLDALTKAIRGVGGETEAEADEPAPARPLTRRQALLQDYEAENAALAEAQDAAPHLNTAAPRALAAALAASHAQHIVLLRRLLGASLVESAPRAFESGTEPPPPPKGG